MVTDMEPFWDEALNAEWMMDGWMGDAEVKFLNAEMPASL